MGFNTRESIAEELRLYGDNCEELYRSRTLSIRANLCRKLDKGIYDHDKAAKLWGYWAEDAAKRYAAEFGGEWHALFPADIRRDVAMDKADDCLREYCMQGAAGPGSFEGEPAFVFYLARVCGPEHASITLPETHIGTTGEWADTDVYELDYTDRRIFPELRGVYAVGIDVNEQGFHSHHLFSDDAELAQAEEFCEAAAEAHASEEGEQEARENFADELREKIAELSQGGRCDSCEAAMIQGVYCHETGCPRYAKLKCLQEQLEELEDW